MRKRRIKNFIIVIIAVVSIFILIFLAFKFNVFEMIDIYKLSLKHPIILEDDNNFSLPKSVIKIKTIEEQKIEEKNIDTKEKVKKIIIDIPFTSQAPFGEWNDARQQEGCEEASIIMAWHWIKNEPLSKQKAKNEILTLSNFEENFLGEFIDTSAEDIVKIFREYYQYEKIKVVYDFNIQDIKNELLNGNIILAPTDGTILKNPFYTSPGPTRHMILIKGFDDNKNQFITNDPGTYRGESFYFDYNVVMKSIINYGTGRYAPLINERKVMIVIEK